MTWSVNLRAQQRYYHLRTVFVCEASRSFFFFCDGSEKSLFFSFSPLCLKILIQNVTNIVRAPVPISVAQRVWITGCQRDQLSELLFRKKETRRNHSETFFSTTRKKFRHSSFMLHSSWLHLVVSNRYDLVKIPLAFSSGPFDSVSS